MNYVITEKEFNALQSCTHQLDFIADLCCHIKEGSQPGLSIDGLQSFLCAQLEVLFKVLHATEARFEAQRQADAMRPIDWLYLFRILSGREAQTPSGSALDIDRKLRAAAELDADMQPVHAEWLTALVEAGARQHPATTASPTSALSAYVSKTAQSGADCIAIGRELLLLKESCRHGEFLKRLEGLQMNARNAQQFMAAAKRFTRTAAQPLVTAAGGIAKLNELLALDEAQIAALEQTGKTGQLTLEGIAGMSVQELRAAIRRERQGEAAADEPKHSKPRRTREKLATVPA